MSAPELVQAVVYGVLGAAGTGALGMTAWGVRRLIGKVDKMDTLIRGDGNGGKGFGEQIRDVHADVLSVRGDLAQHVASEPERITGLVLQLKEELCDGDTEAA